MLQQPSDIFSSPGRAAHIREKLKAASLNFENEMLKAPYKKKQVASPRV